MERRDQVKVKSGVQYDHLFPRAMLTTIKKKEGATVADTIKFIPQVVGETLFHTQKIAKLLKRETVYETCRAVWQFVYDHIAYKKDEDGKEQIRSPARAWHDRGNIQGVDCDCYTVFISSILSNLKIRHILRITKYKEDYFQHIYPIVPLRDGSYITIDCVVRNFDYEEPYSEKKDTRMDLEYLNGVMDSTNKNVDAVELIGIYEDREAMAELGRIFKRKASSSGGSSGGGKKKGKLKEILKKGLHFTNRLNPATAMLRAGILASAKLNVMKIGSRLKYGYLSEEEAKKRGVDMGKFARLKKVREKLENIFYGAGGKPENLKKAILTGRGNKNHDVSGLGYLPDAMEGMDENTAISSLLGVDMYQNELSEVMSGLGELGEPATAATIAAASGIIGAIAGLLKSIGNIFPKKDKASKDFAEGGGEGGGGDAGGSESSSGDESSGGSNDAGSDNSNSENVEGENSKPVVKKSNAPLKKKESGSDGDDNGGGDESSGDSEKKEKNTGSDEGTNGNDGTKPGFWDNNKKWIKPVGIGLGALGLLYAGYRIVTHKKEDQHKPKQLTGIPKSKKSKGGKKANIKSKKNKKASVALL